MNKKSCVKRAFTLIELLIVVVIIGILSSLMIPKYQSTIEKAKMSEARTVLATLRTAEGIYYLENDAYTANMKELSVETNASQLFTYTITMNAGEPIFKATRSKGVYKDATIEMNINGHMRFSPKYKDANLGKNTGNYAPGGGGGGSNP